MSQLTNDVNLELLKTLCTIRATSGDEGPMKDYLLQYVADNQASWKVQPTIVEGPAFQDGFMLVFGKPRSVVFAHMDSIGFTVRYDNQMVPIGGPEIENGWDLVGQDSGGEITGQIVADRMGELLFVNHEREIDRGTTLTFKPNFRQDGDLITCCYLDNRAGIYNALKLAETLNDGVLAFSCWEEHGGGNVSVMARYLYEELGVQQALISDITWVTTGVKLGLGPAISIRDKAIPRRRFLNRIFDLAVQSEVPYQIEVEGSGGSDGHELQKSPYPFDWCFIGAAEMNVHSPNETLHLEDLRNMTRLYDYLMRYL